MKHLYDDQENNMRSKLTEHEFGMVPGAWENMDGRLNQLNTSAGAGTASWSAWFIIGAMVVATTVGLLAYQWQSEPIITDTDNLADAMLNKANNKIGTNVNTTNKSNVSEITTVSNPVITKPIAATAIPPTTLIKEVVRKSIVGPTKKLKVRETSQQSTKQSPVAESPKEEEPTTAPNPDADPSGQRPTNLSKSQTYTRRTEVIHRFSESTLKWRNHRLPAINPRTATTTRSAMLDSPIIILDNPFVNNGSKLEYGVSAGINSKIYGNAGRFSVTPVVGVFIRKSFDKNYGLQAEVQYKMLVQQTMTDPLLIQSGVDEISVNKIGSNNIPEAVIGYVYKIDRMHMVELPISFLYKLNKKHQVSMGVKASYLMAVETGSDEINRKTLTELGFSSLDLGAIAGYEYKLNKHFSLGVFYNVGFMNLTKNNVGGGFSPNYQLETTFLQATVDQGDNLSAVSAEGEGPVFLESPRNLYNSDLRILLRYLF